MANKALAKIEKMARISSQYNEIVKRVANGSLDPDEVRKALQNIIEGNFAVPLTEALERTLFRDFPAWWVPPSKQMEKAFELWPGVTIPGPPTHFGPRTKTEVLLLHVPDTFNSLWDKVVAPDGYAKSRWEDVRAGKRSLRLAPNTCEYTEPVWLAFDPGHGKGARPDSFWEESSRLGPDLRLAASEVFSALIQFPDWPLSWGNGAQTPNLCGFQLKSESKWSSVPYLDLSAGSRKLRLYANWADDRDINWASPSIREC